MPKKTQPRKTQIVDLSMEQHDYLVEAFMDGLKAAGERPDQPDVQTDSLVAKP